MSDRRANRRGRSREWSDIPGNGIANGQSDLASGYTFRLFVMDRINDPDSVIEEGRGLFIRVVGRVSDILDRRKRCHCSRWRIWGRAAALICSGSDRASPEIVNTTLWQDLDRGQDGQVGEGAVLNRRRRIKGRPRICRVTIFD